MSSDGTNLEELLISEVHKSPAIWDLTHSQHKNTYITEKEWVRIATTLHITRKQAEKLWDQLKQRFNKEIKIIPVSKSGSGATNYQSSWPHFAAMQFLRKSVTPRPSSGNLSKFVDPVINKEKSKSTETSESTEDSQLKLLNCVGENESDEDSDWNFFLSLLQYTELMTSYTQKLEFIIKASNLLMDYRKEDESDEDDDDIQVVDFRKKKN